MKAGAGATVVPQPSPANDPPVPWLTWGAIHSEWSVATSGDWVKVAEKGLRREWEGRRGSGTSSRFSRSVIHYTGLGNVIAFHIQVLACVHSHQRTTGKEEGRGASIWNDAWQTQDTHCHTPFMDFTTLSRVNNANLVIVYQHFPHSPPTGGFEGCLLIYTTY